MADQEFARNKSQPLKKKENTQAFCTIPDENEDNFYRNVIWGTVSPLKFYKNEMFKIYYTSNVTVFLTSPLNMFHFQLFLFLGFSVGRS